MPRQLVDQVERLLIIGYISWRQVGRQRDPDAGDRTNQVQFPTVDPAMPARLGPVGLGVNAGVRDDPGGAVALVPDASFGAKHRAIDSDGASTVLPGLQQGHEMSPQATDLFWQGVGQGLE